MVSPLVMVDLVHSAFSRLSAFTPRKPAAILAVSGFSMNETGRFRFSTSVRVKTNNILWTLYKR